MSVAIVTVQGDAHALAVHASLERRGVECHIIETDDISGGRAITVSVGGGEARATVRSALGKDLDLQTISLCWWRRLGAYQIRQNDIRDDEVRSIANSAARETILGAFIAVFRGKYIDHPWNIAAAENKILQLATARNAGLAIPSSIISNDADLVRLSEGALGPEAIAKNIGRPSKRLIKVHRHVLTELYAPEIHYIPTIFQEYVPGSNHLRILVLGDQIVTSQLEATDVDWRHDEIQSAKIISLPNSVNKRILRFMRALGLRMGVLDMKQKPCGGIIFLEVNPQGQFLFLEPATNYPYTEVFTEFLLREAKALGGKRSRRIFIGCRKWPLQA